MKIVIDARMYQESGVGRYIRNLISNLQELDKQNEYFILHLKKDFDKLNYQNNFHKVQVNFHWYGLAEQIKLPGILKKIKPDLVHFPHFNVPIFYNGKFVVTIHDLIHQNFEMRRATTRDPITYKLKQFGYMKVFKNAINISQKILVPSNYVKNSLAEKWGVDEKKIVVTYEAVETKMLEEFSVASSTARNASASVAGGEFRNVLEKFNIMKKYIFYVGNAHPHKNVEGLIRAFLRIKASNNNLQLALSGGDHYFWSKVKKQFEDPDIIYTGFITDQELVGLYQNAECFVQPSFEEGFGIPILEAMALGCPVASSNTGSLPEVGGDAAVYFDPGDQENMIDKIEQVSSNKKLKRDLIEKGRKRVKLFSWEKLAKLTLEVYQQCV